MVDRAGAVSQARTGPDGDVDKPLGTRDRFKQRHATGQSRGDGGGIRAPRAMGVGRLDARRRECRFSRPPAEYLRAPPESVPAPDPAEEPWRETSARCFAP